MSEDCIAKPASELKVMAMTHDSREKEFLYAYEAVAHGLPAEQSVHELRCEDFNKLFAIIDALPDEDVSGLIDGVGLAVEAVETAGRELIQGFVRECKISASFEAQSSSLLGLVHFMPAGVIHAHAWVHDAPVVAGAPPQAAILPVCIRGWRRFHDNRFRHDRYGGYYVQTESLEIVEPAHVRYRAIECDDPIISASARDLCAIEQNSAVRSTGSFGRIRHSQPKRGSRGKGDKGNNDVA